MEDAAFELIIGSEREDIDGSESPSSDGGDVPVDIRPPPSGDVSSMPILTIVADEKAHPFEAPLVEDAVLELIISSERDDTDGSEPCVSDGGDVPVGVLELVIYRDLDDIDGSELWLSDGGDVPVGALEINIGSELEDISGSESRWSEGGDVPVGIRPPPSGDVNTMPIITIVADEKAHPLEVPLVEDAVLELSISSERDGIDGSEPRSSDGGGVCQSERDPFRRRAPLAVIAALLRQRSSAAPSTNIYV